MKAPVAWIREHVELPAEVTTEQLAARLTALGLKLEAIEQPGEQIRGPLVVGKVLTMEPEPQKNGKTIQLVQRRCRRRHRDRRAPGHRLRRAQLRPRRPGRGDPARRRAARQTSRSPPARPMATCRAGHDLLGPRSSASATSSFVGRGSSCCPRAPASPATTHRPCSTSTTRSSSSRSTPTAPTRCPCAAWPARRRSAPPRRAYSTTRRRGRPRRRTAPAIRSSSTTRMAARSSWPATVTGFDPAAPTPGLDGASARPVRPALDLAGRRRHQLRHVRARPSDPRLRRRQAAAAPPGPSRHRG